MMYPMHADVFFFDYGVVACWGMTKNQELTVVNGLAAQVGERARGAEARQPRGQGAKSHNRPSVSERLHAYA